MFGDEKIPEEVAAEWVEKYNDHNANAMCDLVNFVLKCSGCDLKVDIHDIDDPDNATGRVADLQDQFGAQKISDYPLISRAKGNTFSRPAFQSFIQSLVETAHATGVLYSDEALFENIHLWLATMTSSPLRPFRHTATVASLATAMAMCNNVKELASSNAAAERQKTTEEKKKTVNKGRIAQLKAKINESARKHEAAETSLKDIFDTVFVHRYRDVDAKIRIDCAQALGTWIHTCPDIFFEGPYIRYLGWLLSDVSAVRGEVVKQLLKLYKNPENMARLRAFTERFRPRMIEMGTKDADPAIRTSTVELLELVRRMGLLQPDDIDVVGKLIFDTEPKVRKAIAPFFAANVEDTLEVVLDELGGAEIIDETLGDELEDHDSPRKLWLKLKCIAEVLDSYDSEASEENTPVPGVENLLSIGDLESRYSLAAQVVCEGIEEARDWEAIAGFLLYDLSARSRVQTDDPVEAMKKRCQMTEKEEKLLLEVLLASVKARLAEAVEPETDKRGRKTKTRKDEAREIQEATAIHLAKVIPLLLRRYGANPATASVVLRLQRILDLEIFQELRQDTTEYAALLEDINRQFSTHADRFVLAEASHALLYATEFEDLEEVTEGKLQELWASTTTSLRQLTQSKSRQTANIANAVHRVSKLASISDCTEIFVQESKSPKSQSRAPVKVLDVLLNILRDYTDSASESADALLTSAMEAVLYYYLWVTSDITTKVEGGTAIHDPPNYEPFATVLTHLIDARPRLDEVRIAAVMTLLQLHAAFAKFRHQQSTSNEAQSIAALAKGVSQKGQELVLSTFTAAEKAYAKKARRNLEEDEEDELGAAPESDPEDSSDDDDGADDEEDELRTHRVRTRQRALLLAEKRLCDVTGKIVLAIVAQVLDATEEHRGRIRKRLTRNKAKLGANFREVLAFLDEPKPKRSHKAKGKSAERETSAAAKAPAKSKDVEEIEDDEEEEGANEDEAAEAEEEEAEEPYDSIEVDVNHEPVGDDVEDDIMGD